MSNIINNIPVMFWGAGTQLQVGSRPLSLPPESPFQGVLGEKSPEQSNWQVFCVNASPFTRLMRFRGPLATASAQIHGHHTLALMWEVPLLALTSPKGSRGSLQPFTERSRVAICQGCWNEAPSNRIRLCE